MCACSVLFCLGRLSSRWVAVVLWRYPCWAGAGAVPCDLALTSVPARLFA